MFLVVSSQQPHGSGCAIQLVAIPIATRARIMQVSKDVASFRKAVAAKAALAAMQLPTDSQPLLFYGLILLAGGGEMWCC